MSGKPLRLPEVPTHNSNHRSALGDYHSSVLTNNYAGPDPNPTEKIIAFGTHPNSIRMRELNAMSCGSSSLAKNAISAISGGQAFGVPRTSATANESTRSSRYGFAYTPIKCPTRTSQAISSSNSRSSAASGDSPSSTRPPGVVQ